MKNNRKLAVLTGAGRINSIGAATAQLLAAKEYDLIIGCHSSYQQTVKIKQLCEQKGVTVKIYTGDLTQTDRCHNLAELASDWGKIDALVNCIGTTKNIPYSRLEQLSRDYFSTILSVNVIAPFLVIQACRQLLLNAGNGCIVNVSSTAGITGKGSSIAYAAAKGAVNTLTLSLAQALAPHIRVNAVCPAFVDSSWWEGAFTNKADEYQVFLDSMAKNNLLGTVLKPYHVAQAIGFLIESPMMNGELIRLDAGAHIGRGNTVKQ